MIGKTKDGIYFYSVRYKDIRGNFKQKKVQNKEWTTKKEAKEAMERFLVGLTDAKIDTSTITMNALYETFVMFNAGKTKARTHITWDKIYTVHIKPDLGNHIVSKITPHHILLWQTKLLKKNYSDNYTKTIQVFCKSIFLFGVKYEYIQKNPFNQEYVRNNNVNKIEMTIWTTDEFNRFIEKVEDLTYKAFFMSLYWGGLRKGEAFALQDKDINFQTGVINVSKTYDFVNKVTTTPKTKRSTRSIYMTSNVKAILWQLVQEHKKRSDYHDSCLLFGYDTHITATTVKRYQEYACIESGVKICRIHDLRHSHVSLLVSMGFNPVEIADRLGHTVDMVNNVYSHLFTGSQKRMADKLDEMVRESEKPSKSAVIN